MILEHLCEMELAYRGPFELVKPYGGEEGSAYGEGEGIVTGDKTAGQVSWVNHPRRRSDGRMLPDAGGMVKTDDGAKVMFRMQGRTVFRANEKGEQKGGQLLWILFESQDERYLWLNDALCVIEGVIDAQTLRMRFKVYACVNELIA
ncbi:MAG: DUF3237 domain-containing protein [Candidatus Dormibacteraeota bacterium]|nr:DUF3237 domain-containing protein [Candidatus Dormibacteraeota bacterium]